MYQNSNRKEMQSNPFPRVQEYHIVHLSINVLLCFSDFYSKVLLRLIFELKFLYLCRMTDYWPNSVNSLTAIFSQI